MAPRTLLGLIKEPACIKAQPPAPESSEPVTRTLLLQILLNISAQLTISIIMSGVWVPQDMTTQQACKGRKNNTKIMRQLARQFFQWRFRNGYTIPKLTEAFKDRLFTRLDCLYGLQISITLVVLPQFLSFCFVQSPLQQG